MLSYYEILQVNVDATQVEIKSAYRKLSKLLHPDFHNNTKEANVIFGLLHEAYETLSDPIKRKNYNPNNNQNNSYDISSEKYLEIITGYKKIVKDYEKIIKAKNKREQELLNEINRLTNEKPVSQATYSENENLAYQDTKITNEKVVLDFWEVTLRILLLVVVIGVIILLFLIPKAVWILIGLIALPIIFFFRAFK